MLNRLRHFKGQAFFEYVIVITMVFGAFLIFQKYFARSIYGKWKASSDQFAFGKLYDPRYTAECRHGWPDFNSWYDVKCFRRAGCHCRRTISTSATCGGCASSNGCITAVCNSG